MKIEEGIGKLLSISDTEEAEIGGEALAKRTENK